LSILGDTGDGERDKDGKVEYNEIALLACDFNSGMDLPLIVMRSWLNPQIGKIQ